MTSSSAFPNHYDIVQCVSRVLVIAHHADEDCRKQREALWVNTKIKRVEDQIAALRLCGAYLEEQSMRIET
jgi:hypothetical protein